MENVYKRAPERAASVQSWRHLGDMTVLLQEVRWRSADHWVKLHVASFAKIVETVASRRAFYWRHGMEIDCAKARSMSPDLYVR